MPRERHTLFAPAFRRPEGTRAVSAYNARGVYPSARLLVVAAVSAGLMLADHRTSHVEKVRAFASTAALPLQVLATAPGRLYSEMWGRVSSREVLVAEVEALRAQQTHARMENEQLRSLIAENGRLRELMDSRAKVRERVLIAELLDVTSSAYSRRVVLNKGTQHGVSAGYPLIDANGIMGQVVSAGLMSSNALLITDPNHALPVQADRTGLRAVAVGTGAANTIRLDHVPNNADLEAGDLVVTSGLGGRFPSGYPVGRVVSIERYQGLPFARVTLEPAAKLERNREVLVLRPGEAGADEALPALEELLPGTGVTPGTPMIRSALDPRATSG